MPDDSYRVIEDPQWGYRRLDPLPSADDLSDFYQSQYYDLIRKGGRAPDLKRYLEAGSGRDKQAEWQEKTLYANVVDALRGAPGPRVLEVGCGVGLLVKYLADNGFDARGIEPSPEAVEVSKALDANVEVGDFNAYRQAHADERLDAVVMLNVLEHVRDPVSLLRQIHECLADNGMLVIRVPNDFSEIQRAAHAKVGGSQWWVAIPDHISYFDYESLSRLLADLDYDVVDMLGDFPMELFLLMGRDYANNPELGSACHKERVSLELALPIPQLRSMYRALATAGVGRNCFVVARRSSDDRLETPRVDMSRFARADGDYTFVGLRKNDVQEIRQWRNTQQDVLRQHAPLTEAEQERWWQKVVDPTHRRPDPEFLLVSILTEGNLVGYGGLTHIDWLNERAEISFLVDTKRAAEHALYEADLMSFWRFVQRWAFEDLGLRRLWTETYAFRQAHVALLERAGMTLEGRMRGHIKTQDGFSDSLIHGCIAEECSD